MSYNSILPFNPAATRFSPDFDTSNEYPYSKLALIFCIYYLEFISLKTIYPSGEVEIKHDPSLVQASAQIPLSCGLSV